MSTTETTIAEIRRRQSARKDLFAKGDNFDLQTVIWDLDALLAELDKREAEIRRLQREAREDADSAAAEAVWRERQDTDYGSY